MSGHRGEVLSELVKVRSSPSQDSCGRGEEVWLRSGACCAICRTYLLEGKLIHREFSLGELAHIVGQQNTPGSPRGQVNLPKIVSLPGDSIGETPGTTLATLQPTTFPGGSTCSTPTTSATS